MGSKDMTDGDMTERTVRIARVGAGGDGIVDGLNDPSGQSFVPFALEGERVTLDRQGNIARIDDRHAARIAPFCRHFGTCGGCISQHMGPELYAAWKREGLVSAFEARGLRPAFGPLQAIPLGTRRRATFSCEPLRETGQPATLSLGYHRRRSHTLIALEVCGVLTPRIERALGPLKALLMLMPQPLWTARVFVADVAEGLDVNVTPDADAKSLPAPLREKLAQAAEAMGIVRMMVGGEIVMTTTVPHLKSGKALIPLPPVAFFQASEAAEAQMTAAVRWGLDNKKIKRVVDLFAGLGPFTIAAAERAHVKAVDSDQAALAALVRAVRATPGLKPVETLRRDLYRDPLGPLELNGFDAAILDPPRAGAEAQVATLARSTVKTVVYASCNPATLARDARTLVDGGFRIERVDPIDQFVHAAHLEAVAVFKRG